MHELERPEFKLLAEKGLVFADPFDAVAAFEKMIANHVGAPYAIAVDCCTHAIELSLRYLQSSGEVKVPRRTYLSVPMTLQKLGLKIAWTDENWNGSYQLHPYPIVDASVGFEKQSYQPGTFHCLSFQQKKTISIGRGGMILTDDAKAADWLTKASYDGRHRGKAWKEDNITMLGYHYYMTPEDAARGILLFKALRSRPRIGSYLDYPDISTQEVFNK